MKVVVFFRPSCVFTGGLLVIVSMKKMLQIHILVITSVSDGVFLVSFSDSEQKRELCLHLLGHSKYNYGRMLPYIVDFVKMVFITHRPDSVIVSKRSKAYFTTVVTD